MEEARYYGIESIICQLETLVENECSSRDIVPLSRRDVIEALISTSSEKELRFQGVNLAGADLSKLDLRNINFKVLRAAE